MSSVALHSCGKATSAVVDPGASSGTDSSVVENPDSVVLQVLVHEDNNISTAAGSHIGSLDILVYGGSPLLTLEKMVHVDDIAYPAPEQLSVDIAVHDTTSLTVVALANMPGLINESAVAHYDALSQLTMDFRDDDPERPFMSGTATVMPGLCPEAAADGGEAVSCTITVTPLMGCVQVASVTNMNNDDTLLENPRVHFSGMCTRAELLRDCGFLLSEPADGDVVRLPYDIGLYTQYPGTRLYCYPADMPLTDGEQPTRLVLEYERDAAPGDPWSSVVQCSATFDVHPIQRNAVTQIDIAAR